MTYLEIVNNVLRRLRENEASSVSDTAYTQMVGDFVNDAKKLVEAAWDWSALRDTSVSFDTVAGTATYALTGSQDNIKTLNVYNTTQGQQLTYADQKWIDNKYNAGNEVSGVPTYYTYAGIDSNGDTQIKVYPEPDDVYSISVKAAIRQEDLTADSDVLLVPNMPVIHLSLAMLARERGETGGATAAEYFTVADKYLSDAVALDAAKHPEETIWYTP